MKCVFFSDLHIKAAGDDANLLFEQLCSHSLVKEATHIFLLGDIFDLLIGEHPQYFNKYPSFFKSLIDLVNNSKSVIYLEGNHDFHIDSSLTEYVKNHCDTPSDFRYLRSGEIIKLGDESYYFCHGDEVDFENEAFKRWKRIYSSKEFAFFINKILKFNFIDFLGNKVSNNSKNRGKKVFDHFKMKNKYIAGAKKLIASKGVHGVICGHTHIQENHTFEDGTKYYNCGHPLSDKNFLYFDGLKFSFVNLKDS